MMHRVRLQFEKVCHARATEEVEFVEYTRCARKLNLSNVQRIVVRTLGIRVPLHQIIDDCVELVQTRRGHLDLGNNARMRHATRVAL